MTVAVCWKCGEMKWGAFNACPKCKAAPSSEDDMAISLAMSDHYFDKPTMEQMGADIAAGKPLQLDPATRLNLINTIRGVGTNVAKATGIDCQPQHSSKKPWWKRLF